MADETIVVPQDEAQDMLDLGATCGPCGQGDCCPDTPVVDDKIDMCTKNGKTINVSVNACKGILNSGGTCGPCPEVIPEIDPEPPPDE